MPNLFYIIQEAYANEIRYVHDFDEDTNRYDLTRGIRHALRFPHRADAENWLAEHLQKAPLRKPLVLKAKTVNDVQLMQSGHVPAIQNIHAHLYNYDIQYDRPDDQNPVIRGGYVIANSLPNAVRKIMAKFQDILPDLKEQYITVWSIKDDDDYDPGHPDVIERYDFS